MPSLSRVSKLSPAHSRNLNGKVVIYYYQYLFIFPIWMAHGKWKLALASLFFKWADYGPFCLFSFFSNANLQKNCRHQRDSNSDRWSRRRARWPLDHHHGPYHHYSYPVSDLSVIERFWRKSSKCIIGHSQKCKSKQMVQNYWLLLMRPILVVCKDNFRESTS